MQFRRGDVVIWQEQGERRFGLFLNTTEADTTKAKVVDPEGGEHIVTLESLRPQREEGRFRQRGATD